MIFSNICPLSLSGLNWCITFCPVAFPDCMHFPELPCSIPQTGWLGEQKCILTQFWRLETWNQRISQRLVLSEGTKRESLLCLSVNLRWALIFGIPCLMGATLHLLPPSSCGSFYFCILWPHSLCVSFLSLGHQSYGIESPLYSCITYLANYSCNNPISK